MFVEFRIEDGITRNKRPIWSLWIGPEDVALQSLCPMYLWRFAIEHLFPSLKQHMGLNSNRSRDLVTAEKCEELRALAYQQLLRMCNLVQPNRPAWHTGSRHHPGTRDIAHKQAVGQRPSHATK